MKDKEQELQGASSVYPYSKHYSRTSINTILGAADGGRSLVGGTIIKAFLVICHLRYIAIHELNASSA